MIHVRVILHAHLREKLPPESGGRCEMTLPEGSRVADVIARLDLPGASACAVNGQIERDPQRLLQEGDEVRFFRPGAGGGQEM